MTYCKKACYAIFLIFCFCLKSYSQTKSLEEVNVDLGSGVFFGQAGLPFDVPFRISGDVTPNLRKINVIYRIKPSDFKSWMRFPSKINGQWSDTVTWNYTDVPVKDQKFRLTIGPLHPNVAYEFKFTVLETPPIDATKKTNLRESLFESLNTFLANLSTVDMPTITLLNAELNAKMTTTVGPNGTIINLNGTPFVLNLLSPPLSSTTNAIIDNNDSSVNATGDIALFTTIFSTGKPEFVTLGDIVGRIARHEIVLDAASKAIWDAPVVPNVASLKDLKFSEMAGLLADLSQPWNEVFDGTAKISLPSISAAQEVDNASFLALSAFFHTINRGLIRDSAATPTDLFASIQGEITGSFIPASESTVATHKLLKDLKTRHDDLLSKFPDVLADKLLSLSYVIIDQSVSDVVSQNTPYIGLDFGLSFVPGYTQLFFYEGVNFYFVPVNKDAPLSRMKGFWNSLSKRLSIHMGLTHSLIEAENKNYQPLIKNVGSILLGAGIRVSRILRLNYGSLLFYEKNPNPLIEKKDFKAMYAFSITFDINIGKALGDIGQKLGIK